MLLSKEVFDNQERKLTSLINTYEHEETALSTNYTLYSLSCEWLQFYRSYTAYRDIIVTDPVLLCQLGGAGAPGGGCYNDCIWPRSYYNCESVPFAFISNTLSSGWAKLKETETTEYFYVGTTSTTASETNSRSVNSYDTTNFQINQKDVYYEENGVEQHQQTKYFYPTDPSFYGSYVAELLSLNKANEVLAIVQYKNGEKIKKEIDAY